MKPIRKVLIIEIETNMSNKQLRDWIKRGVIQGCIRQVQINAIKREARRSLLAKKGKSCAKP